MFGFFTRITRVILSLWLIFVSCGLAYSAETETETEDQLNTPLIPEVTPSKLPPLMALEQALALAENVHPALLARQAKILESRAERLNAGLDTRWQAQLHLEARGADLLNNDDGFVDDSRARLSLSKLLWDFGLKDSALDIAGLGAQSAEIDLDYATRLQRIEIMRQFFAVLAADYQFSADNEFMSLAFFPFDRAQERLERFDSVSALDMMEKRAVYLEALRQRNQTIRLQRASRLKLALAMGRPDAKPIDLIEPELSIYVREVPDFDELLAKILDTHPMIRRMQLELDQLKAQEKRVGATEKPSVSLQLQATEYAQAHRLRDRSRASILFKIPLLTKKLNTAEYLSLAAQIEAKRATMVALDYEIRSQVLAWVQRLEWLSQTIEQNVQNLEFRERALDKNRLLYEMEVNAIIGRAQADMAKLIWQDAEAKFERALIWEQIDAVTGAGVVNVQ